MQFTPNLLQSNNSWFRIRRYDSKLYTVSTAKDSAGNDTVNVTGKNVSTNSAVFVYVPKGYSKVSANVDNGSFESKAMNNSDIRGTFKNSYVEFSIPKQFSGTIDAQIQDGCYIQVSSGDSYKNCKTTITKTASKYELMVPSYFTVSGTKYTYTNGTQAGNVNVTFASGSGMGTFE